MTELKIRKTDDIFGTYDFDAYNIDVVEGRRRYAPIPKPYRALDADEITNGTKISRSFTLGDFTGAERTRTLLKDVTEATPEVVLTNLQQLCFEAMDPATEFVGGKPIVRSGLVSVGTSSVEYNPTLEGVKAKGDTIFEAFARGEGCAIQYEFDNEMNLKQFALYIRRCVIFDRCVLHHSSVYEDPSLIIVVNGKARRMVYTMKGSNIVSKGLAFNV